MKKVPRLGPKAYEQAVGFLRIIDGKNVFDNTDIHPESYPAAKALLAAAGLKTTDVGTTKAQQLNQLDLTQLATSTGVGELTLKDIGVKQDGLVHVSKLTDKFLKDPRQAVAVGDIVTVWVEEVDEQRQRIALTMIAPAEA